MLYYLHHNKFGWPKNLSPHANVADALLHASSRSDPKDWTVVEIDTVGIRRKKVKAWDAWGNEKKLPVGLPRR